MPATAQGDQAVPRRSPSEPSNGLKGTRKTNLAKPLQANRLRIRGLPSRSSTNRTTFSLPIGVGRRQIGNFIYKKENSPPRAQRAAGGNFTNKNQEAEKRNHPKRFEPLGKDAREKYEGDRQQQKRRAQKHFSSLKYLASVPHPFLFLCLPCDWYLKKRRNKGQHLEPKMGTWRASTCIRDLTGQSVPQSS